MRGVTVALILSASTVLLAQTPRLVRLAPAANDLEIVQVLIKPPREISARELGAWQLLCAGFFEGSADFVKEDIFLYGGQAGTPPQVSWTNELCRVQWIAPKGGGNTIARLTESLLAGQVISEEVLARTRSFLASPFSDDWSPALQGERGDLTVPAEFVRLTRDRLIRPDTVTICATPGAFSSFGGRFRDWQPRRVSPDLRVGRKSGFIGPETAKVIQWRGTPLLPITSQSAKLLGMVALGGGKTALLHQVIRDEMGLSYRQEAFLLPSPTGWQPVIQMGGATTFPDSRSMQEKLVQASDRWTSSDLERFKKLAVASLEGRNPLSPFWLSTRGPHQDTEADRAAFEALAYLWGCEQTTIASLKSDLRSVTLEELQEAVKDLLNDLR